MLKLDNLTKALNEFGDKVIEDSKKNLVDRKKVASGKLLNSMKNNGAKVTAKSLELNINMADYGAFIDKGVSGVKVKYDTPYSYTNKMPPPSALDGWIVRKGIAPRNGKGQFTGRSISSVGFEKSIQFLIARKIFFNGIKPTHFLSDAVKKNFNLLPDIIQKSFIVDTQKAIDFIIKSNFNK